MDELTKAFLTRLWLGSRYSYFFVRPELKSYWTRSGCPDQPPPATESDVYFGMHGVDLIPPCNAEGEPREPQYVRARIDFVSAINCVYADIDRFPNEPDTKFWNRVENIRPAPSVIVATGGGAHVYVLLSETLLLSSSELRHAAARLQRRWCEAVNGEGKDLARAPRLPGTLNHKYSPARHVEFARCDLKRGYTLSQIRSVLPPVPPPSPNAGIPEQFAGPTDALAQRLLDMALTKQSRNEGGIWLACQLRDNRFEEAASRAILKQYVSRVPQTKNHAYREYEALASLRQVYAKPPRQPLQEKPR